MMKREVLKVNSETIIVLIPDVLCNDDNREKDMQALWLIPPAGESADVWELRTDVKEMAESAKAMIICLPGIRDEDFYAETVWDKVHEQFVALSTDPRSHRLLGVFDGALMCLSLALRRTDRFNVVVAVSPTEEGSDAVIEYAEAFKESQAKWPRMVIADSSEGYGRTLGDAINAFGAGMHVHSERPVNGWPLMNSEIRSCLAHL